MSNDINLLCSDSSSDADSCDYYKERENFVNVIDEENICSNKWFDLQIQTLSLDEAELFIDSCVREFVDKCHVDCDSARHVLCKSQWYADRAISNCRQLLAYMKPSSTIDCSSHENLCGICFDNSLDTNSLALICGHSFCYTCWHKYIVEIIYKQQLSRLYNASTFSTITCPHFNCIQTVTVSLVHALSNILKSHAVRTSHLVDKLLLDFKRYILLYCVKTHNRMTSCPDCGTILLLLSRQPSVFSANHLSVRRALCHSCGAQFCFLCGGAYHAPCCCDTIVRWHLKCCDDSETANYILTHTKQCPQCATVIEKVDGCNHIQCTRCSHEFCWTCLDPWSLHFGDFYQCSRYKDSVAVSTGLVSSLEQKKTQARNALKRYLHYYERWQNHSHSLTLESATRCRIQRRIDNHLASNGGQNRDHDTSGADCSWIDWHYLLDACDLLAITRRCLQYTYPCAFYMKDGTERELFEHRQAQLEMYTEQLSWWVEHAQRQHRGALENLISCVRRSCRVILEQFITTD